MWSKLESYGLGYRLVNGNYGMAYKDKTHMFQYLENGHEMISYIPRDTSAQLYWPKGKPFANFLIKKVKIFEKVIKQLKF